MSAEATVAVIKHAEGSDAERWMLAVLSAFATPAGFVSDVGMTELAQLMGKTERGTGMVKRRLLDSGQLVISEPGGGRHRKATYRIVLPGLEEF